MASGLKKSPAKFLGAIAGLAGGAVSIFGGLSARKKARAERRKAQRELSKQKKAFEKLDTSNLYADVTNPYAGLETQFENVYEDLTVNQQQAQFQAQQQAQQRADVMQNLRGAAGGSGIAALAQTMASQQALGTQQISADIGKQEAANQLSRAKGAADVRTLEMGREEKIAGGDWEAEQARIKGAEASRGLEYQKTQAFMGMAAGQLSAAKQAEASAQQQITGGIGQAIGGIASGVASGLGNIGEGKNFFGGLSGESKGFLGDLSKAGLSDEYVSEMAGALPGGGSWLGNLANKY